MTNIERMTSFLNDVQGMFMQYGWPYILPKVSATLDKNDEPSDRLIDAYWKTNGFKLLLSFEDGSFCFYGDDNGNRKFKKSDASPQDVAEALHLLQTAKAES